MSVVIAKWILKILSERGMFMWMLRVTVVLKVIMKNLEWGKCLCECYVAGQLLLQSEYE
jgi:hypothetical protein